MSSSQPQPPVNRPRRSGTRKWLRRVVVVACLVALVVAAGLYTVTRSWFIISQVTPQLERKLGGEVRIRSAAYQGDGRILFRDISLHARTLRGPASQVARIGAAVITIDFSSLVRGKIRISDIDVDEALLRISEDADGGRINVAELKPVWSMTGGKSMLPPRVNIRNATLEFGWHDSQRFEVMGRRLVAGEMHPTASVGRWYSFMLGEVDQQGNGLRDGILMKGEWNAASNETHSRVDGVELDDRIYRMCPHVVRLMWDRMDLKGRVNGVAVDWKPDEPFTVTLAVQDVALTLPIETANLWSRFRDGKMEPTHSRPRMHVYSGDIKLSSNSLILDTVGEMGSSEAKGDMIGVPYNVSFTMTDLPPMAWDEREQWVERVIQTAPFDLKFRMDDFSLKRNEAGQSPAVDLPTVVAKVLGKFNVTDWVLSTSVNVSRAAPTIAPDGTVIAATTITNGQALIDKASGRYQKFPYQLENVEAYLQFDNERVTVHYLRGDGSNDAKLRITGQIAPPENDAMVDLRLTGTNVPLDDRLRSALHGNELVAFDAMFNRPASESLAAAGMLPDEHAIEDARVQLLAAQQRLSELSPDQRDPEAQSLQREIARLQRFIDAGPFELGGEINIDLKIERELGPGKRTGVTGTIDVIKAGLIYEKFPYPIRVTSGSLDWRKDRVVIAPGSAGQGATIVMPGGGRGTAQGELQFPQSRSSKKLLPNLHIKVEDDAFNDAVYAAIPLTRSEREQSQASPPWPGGRLSNAARIVRGIGLNGPADYAGVISTNAEGRIGYDFTVSMTDGQALPTEELAKALGSEKELWPPGAVIQGVAGQVRVTREAVEWNDIAGMCNQSALRASGRVELSGEDTSTTIALHMENVPVEPYVLNLAPGERRAQAQALWDVYQPHGTIDASVEYDSRRPRDRRTLLRAAPREASLLIDSQRVAVTGKGGAAQFESGRIHFDELALDLMSEAEVANGTLLLNGELSTNVADELLDLRGTWSNGRLDSALVSHVIRLFASNDVAHRYWTSHPQGAFDADFQVQRAGVGPPRYDFAVRPRWIDFNWNGASVSMNVVDGQVIFQPGAVAMRGVRGRHSDGDFSIDGVISTAQPIDAMLNLEFTGHLRSSLVQAFLPDRAMDALDAIKFVDDGASKLLDGALHVTQVNGADEDGSPQWQTAFSGNVITTSASFEAGTAFSEVDGEFKIDLKYAPGEAMSLDILASATRAKAMGQVLNNVRAPITLTDKGQRISVADMRAEIEDGVVTAKAWAGIGEQKDYAVFIEMSGVPLDGFSLSAPPPSEGPAPAADRNGASGDVYASLSLSGVRDDKQSRRGRGIVRVLHGRMASIPLALQLMQVIQLTAPFSGSLDYAEASMYLAGDRVVFEHILFESSLGKNSLLQLLGEGEMNFDTLELNAHFRSRSGVAIVRDIVGEIGDRLYGIEVTGSLGQPQARVVPLPASASAEER